MTAALRILAVTNLWPEGGSFRGVFVEEQVEALRKLGHHVDVEVVAQSRGSKDYLLAAPRVRARVKAGSYDVVHIHYGMTAASARLVGNVPRVLSLYGSDVNSPKEHRITQLGSGGVAKRIYVSKRLAQTAGDQDGVVIPNGVDFATFVPADREAARAALGIEPHEKVVLFGGMPTNSVKGYDVFSDVLKELKASDDSIRELVLSAPNQPVEKIVEKYNAADVFLFTSRKGSEGSPTVVKEAVAMGLPVVSVDVGDVAEITREVTPSQVVAFAEPWGTPAAREALVKSLADAVTEVLDTKSRSNGREACGWLDSPRIAERIVEVYRSVVR
ncbi:hypothetical protein GCM10009765_27900 [Fodinicola feengrottensis]|uniref:Glycosyltransferase subfamily 4-like N-terminal domain-containing protein n=1 Tax=Fodinicola feengrottensis TaxID=435914 RepID=A0ABP4STI0_9ACTN